MSEAWSSSTPAIQLVSWETRQNSLQLCGQNLFGALRSAMCIRVLCVEDDLKK